MGGPARARGKQGAPRRMHTTMLTKVRSHNVFSGTRQDMRGVQVPDATLSDSRDDHADMLAIAGATLTGVKFRSAVPLTPGKMHYLSAKGPSASSLASPLRIVSCKLRA